MDNLFTILLCSVIGYITNYIAIKMLFRPYNEIRVLGMRVPFTPGIIPKEKERIAVSISEAISSHILNKEYLKELLTKDKTRNTIKSTLNQYITEILTSSRTLKSMVSSDANSSVIENNITEYILQLISKNLQKEKNIELISDYIYKQSVNIIENKNQVLKDKIASSIELILKKDTTREAINSVIISSINNIDDETRINDIFSGFSYEHCERMVLKNEDKIINTINVFLDSDDTKEIIQSAATKIIKSQLGSLVSMFLSTDTIGDRANEAIKEYINDTDNRVDLLKGVTSGLYNIQFIKVGALKNFISTNIDLKDFLQSILTSSSTSNIIDNLIDQGISKAKNNLALTLKDSIYQNIRRAAYSSEFNSAIRSYVYSMVNRIVNRPFNSLNIKSEGIVGYTDQFAENILDILANKIDSILDYINVTKIVREKIIEFDVRYAEEIILSIVNKELKAITMFGAVLGALIGVVTILI
ncbi:MAG: DUF445 family protein [Clostridium sp.]